MLKVPVYGRFFFVLARNLLWGLSLLKIDGCEREAFRRQRKMMMIVALGAQLCFLSRCSVYLVEGTKVEVVVLPLSIVAKSLGR